MTKAALNSHDAGQHFKWRDRFVLVLAVLLYAGARLWRLDSSCLWFDEIFSVHAARHDWHGLLSFVAADLIHPPLFYLLLKIWIGIGGQSLWWLRLSPALTAIAALVPFLLLARELKLRPSETNLSLVLMAANGYLIKYAQELRMYSLLLFFTLCSLWLFVKLCHQSDTSKKNLVALFVVNLLLVYTHYYGWLVVVAEIFFLLLWKREQRRTFLLSVAALILCYSPWAAVVFSAAGASRGLGQNIGWVTRPGLSDVAQMLTLLHEPFYFRQSSDESAFIFWSAPLWFLLFVSPIALLIWNTARRGRDEQTTRDKKSVSDVQSLSGLLLFPFLPPVLAFCASRVLPYSIWGTRHLIIIAAPYLMLAAVAMLRLRRLWAKSLAAVLLCCWLLFGGLVLLSRPSGNYIWCTWETLAGRMVEDESGAPGAIRVYAFEDLVAYHLWFTLDTAGERRFKVAVIKGVPSLLEDPAYFLPRAFDGVRVSDISAVKEARFWVAFRDESPSEERPPLKDLKEKGYVVEKIFEQEAQGQTAFLALMRRSRT